MMRVSRKGYGWQDPMYGLVELTEPLASLVGTPIVQRMRHVRLSNINSLDLPSIANLSRFEHVLGVAYLSGLVPIRREISTLEHIALGAAALLHDWAITAYGHLLEEALQYVGIKFAHETRLAEISAIHGNSDVGGLEYRQILVGREAGLVPWAMKAAGTPDDGKKLVDAITNFVRGRGKLGRIICGTIDIDNIDNVFRMAFHMGLDVDRSCARRLAAAIVGIDASKGEPIFNSTAVPDIEAWLETRRRVYDCLMLSERDFAGKLMLIYAATKAFEVGDLGEADWADTDEQFFAKLLSSKSSQARNAAERWTTGELWDVSSLVWMTGSRPHYPALMEYSKDLSEHIGRECFAYGIHDKRQRALTLIVSGSGTRTFGTNADQWLLGFGSPVRRPFTSREMERAMAFTETRLCAKVRGRAVRASMQSQEPTWLI